jgi:multidrug resistance efflux pump
MNWVKHVLAVVGAFALIAAGAASYVVLTAPTASAQLAQSSAPPVRVETPNTPLSAKGRVVPVSNVHLSFRAKGTASDVAVAVVAVRPGDRVEKGDVLAILDTRDLELRAAEAQAALDQARLQLETITLQSEAAQMRAEANLLNIEGEAAASRIRAEAEASKLRADANVARLFGRTTAASGLDASADGVLQAASAEQTNALQYRDRLAAALETEKRTGASALALASAQVREAEATLKRAQLAVEMATLRAPFAGMVATVNYRVGEIPAATSTGIILADVSDWFVEISSLSEKKVASIQEGDQVNVIFDAVSGLAIPGKVDYISSQGSTTPGSTSTTYSVLISLDQQDPGLRWDMSATVTFLSKEPPADTSDDEASSAD